MTPDTLRRAATLLRARAEKATPGPWEALCDGYGDISGGRSENERRDLLWVRAGTTNAGDVVSTYGMPDGPRAENVTHIAALHPAVAQQLATWLEHEADRDEHQPWTDDVTEQALAFATAYLGEEME